MNIIIYPDLIQGSDAWHSARCGLLTASEMHLIVTPTLKVASNEKERAHLFELLAQRITQYVEPSYITDSMLRGHADEIEASILYAKHYEPVEQVGFMTNDKWGFKIGYSPDGLVGKDGLLECKSRNQKLQLKTIVEYFAKDTIDPDFMIQCQTGLLVSERKWIDLVSYCGGLPMATCRVFPDEKIQTAIIEAATAFESRLAIKLDEYNALMPLMIPTERRIEQEIF